MKTTYTVILDYHEGGYRTECWEKTYEGRTPPRDVKICCLSAGEWRQYVEVDKVAYDPERDTLRVTLRRIMAEGYESAEFLSAGWILR